MSSRRMQNLIHTQLYSFISTYHVRLAIINVTKSALKHIQLRNLVVSGRLVMCRDRHIVV